MRALYVDTGIWVALLDAADPRHAQARSVLEVHRSYSLISTDLVLSETVTLLRRELGPKTAATFGREFLEGKIGILLRCEPSDWLEGLALLEKRSELKLSVADATSFAVIRRLDIEKAASFDRHFRIVLSDREVIGGSA